MAAKITDQIQTSSFSSDLLFRVSVPQSAPSHTFKPSKEGGGCFSPLRFLESKILFSLFSVKLLTSSPPLNLKFRQLPHRPGVVNQRISDRKMHAGSENSYRKRNFRILSGMPTKGSSRHPGVRIAKHRISLISLWVVTLSQFLKVLRMEMHGALLVLFLDMAPLTGLLLSVRNLYLYREYSYVKLLGS